MHQSYPNLECHGYHEHTVPNGHSKLSGTSFAGLESIHDEVREIFEVVKWQLQDMPDGGRPIVDQWEKLRVVRLFYVPCKASKAAAAPQLSAL